MKLMMTICMIASFHLIYSQADGKTIQPEETEVWTPVPPVVDAGTNGGPPSDAVILFDGTSLDAWCSPTHPSEKSELHLVREDASTASNGNDRAAARWRVVDGCLEVVPGLGAIETRQSFGSIQLHIEWMAPEDTGKTGQAYSNSGIFLMGLYEIQVLNAYENQTYSNGMAGAVYKQHIPLVNAARPPGEWQAYDIVFNAPVFTADGQLNRPADVTVFWNNVLVQNRAELDGPTLYIGKPAYFAHAPELPLRLQDHGDKVRFRNIWVRRLGN